MFGSCHLFVVIVAAVRTVAGFCCWLLAVVVLVVIIVGATVSRSPQMTIRRRLRRAFIEIPLRSSPETASNCAAQTNFKNAQIPRLFD